MIRQTFAAASLAAALAFAAACSMHLPEGGLAPAHDDALRTAVAAPARTPANIARDRYRHPYETLAFFGVRPSDTVVEIWPGGGWYTEILAPYLRQGGGTLYAAALPGMQAGIERIRGRDASLYGGIRPAEASGTSGGTPRRCSPRGSVADSPSASCGRCER